MWATKRSQKAPSRSVWNPLSYWPPPSLGTLFTGGTIAKCPAATQVQFPDGSSSLSFKSSPQPPGHHVSMNNFFKALQTFSSTVQSQSHVHILGVHYRSNHFQSPKSDLNIYHCVINYPQMEWLKTTNTLYVTDALGQEFRSHLMEWFWLKVSHEFAVRRSAERKQPSQRLVGLPCIISRWLPSMAASRRPQLSQMDSPWFQGQDKENTRWSWNMLYYQKVRKYPPRMCF